MVDAFGVDPAALVFALRRRELGMSARVATVGPRLVEGFESFCGAARVGPVVARLLAQAPLGLSAGSARVVSSIGQVLAVDVRPAEALALPDGAPVVLAAPLGWREWSAPVIADALRSAGHQVVVAPLQLIGCSPDAAPHQLARHMADVAVRYEWVQALKRVLAAESVVLLPPIFGVTSTGVALRTAMAAELGVPEARLGAAVMPGLPSAVSQSDVLSVIAAQREWPALDAAVPHYIFTRSGYRRAEAMLAARGLEARPVRAAAGWAAIHELPGCKLAPWAAPNPRGELPPEADFAARCALGLAAAEETAGRALPQEAR